MTKEYILETPRLIIRKFSKKDADHLKPILGDPEVMKFSKNGPCDQRGIEDYIDRILTHYQEKGFGLWCLVLKESNEIIGLSGLIVQVIDEISYVELAYRLAQKYWGKGLATEAAEAVKNYAFNTLKIDRLISIISPENVRSIQVAKRVGMKRARSAQYHGFNVDIYEIKRT